ncbi:transcription antitermination factor NusB [Pelagibaculum spongiae]|uniref:Transcription antitermination protein NusB n=1 Tax=Pelagibaculum spongiae TaxID=2080658 RepID=A0A2V1GWH4_9GAMM|nr:transcription antitermination factor NusB [Pelagibaculum spongiae]PVZ71531.1 transcription antitermination factor NusB [Pelagibaculum spongiae]
MNPAARRKARKLAVQALYQWQMTGHSIVGIEGQFLADNDFKRTDSDYFKELFCRAASTAEQLDAIFSEFSSRPLKEITPVELSILRLATYELSVRVDVPVAVAINEALDLTNAFGADDSNKFVNSILDKTAAKLRPNEARPAE